MWEPYLKLVRQKCTKALHILDRFHIVAKMNKALDEVRAKETRRMKHDGLDPVLRKSRWLVLKRQENLADERRFRLRDLLRYNLKASNKNSPQLRRVAKHRLSIAEVGQVQCSTDIFE